MGVKKEDLQILISATPVFDAILDVHKRYRGALPPLEEVEAAADEAEQKVRTWHAAGCDNDSKFGFGCRICDCR